MILALPLVGLVLPFLLWVIETVFPYPHIVEEIGKAVFVVLVWQTPHRSTKIKLTALMALFFAFSESVFYLFNFSVYGDLSFFFLRLATTTALHITTALIILLPTLKSKKLIFLSLPLAIIFHYLYNTIVHNIYSL